MNASLPISPETQRRIRAAAKNRLRLRARTVASLMTAGVVIAMQFTDGWAAWALWGLALAIFAAPYALGWR